MSGAQDDVEAEIQQAITSAVEEFHAARRKELAVVDEAADKRRTRQLAAVQMLRRCGLNNTEIGLELGITDARVGQIFRSH